MTFPLFVQLTTFLLFVQFLRHLLFVQFVTPDFCSVSVISNFCPVCDAFVFFVQIVTSLYLWFVTLFWVSIL